MERRLHKNRLEVLSNGVFAIIILFAGLASFGVTNSQVTKDNAQEFAELELRARQIVTYHCGSCHTPGLKTSNPSALKVYNLSDGGSWWKKLTQTRLKKSRTMLSSRTSATKAELEENFFGWKFKARAPTPDELRSYSDFVEAALLKTHLY